MKERTLSNILESFSARGSETAYVQKRGFRTQRWSYRQIFEVSTRFACEIAARNIRPQQRIVIWGEDCAEWVAAFFGAVTHGAVVVPMDRAASPGHVRRICGQVAPRLLVCSRNLPDAGVDVPVLFLEDLAETVARRPKTAEVRNPVSPGDAAEIIYTSGTTSEPKGVVLSHENILANLDPLEKEIRKYLKYERFVHPVRFMNLLPLSHVFGQYLGLFIPQILGGTVVFQNSLNPSEIIRSIRRGKISVLVAVPRILDSLRDALELELDSDNLKSDFQKRFERARSEHFLKRWWIFRSVHRRFGWKFWAFICGGASLGADTEKFWTTLGFAVIQGYGLTETTSLISLNHPFKISGGTIGKVLPGREVRLSGDGEILVRGVNVAKSYFKDNTFVPLTDEDGWFRTGDIASMDANGNLCFKGRSKNVIVNSEGMNIFPEDLEKALKETGGVRDCVVFGLERAGNPEPCAVLLLHDGQQPAEDIVGKANHSLAAYQHIRLWCVWPDEDFPRTSTQKPMIGKIREFAASKLLGTGTGSAGNGILTELIRQITGRSVEGIRQDSSLAKDLDLSSIERVQLLAALENRFQLELNETSFTEASTIGDIESMLGQTSLGRSDYAYPRWTQRSPVALLRNAIFYALVWTATMLMARPRISGRKNLERLKGPALFVSNHVTQVDVAFVLTALPARFRHRLAVAMLGELLQGMRRPKSTEPVWKQWVSRIKYGLVTALFNVFPLPQKTGFRESFRFAGESVDRGYSILVFPEGGRTTDGLMHDFQAGIGLLAKDLRIPVVPLRIDGLYAIKKSGKMMARAGAVSVRIGAPESYSSGMDAVEIAADLQKRVASL